jgi:pimeloyl-ACP methyl ester carboxylesterase
MTGQACSEHFITLAAGLRMYCRDYGAGLQDAPPVLCIPGLTRNSRDFGALASWLATQHRVLAPDLRGRGRSDRDPEWHNYHPMTYVDDVLALLDQFRIARAIVIGTSLGGLIAMLLAARAPGRLAAVVLNDIGPEFDPVGLARIASYAGRMPPVTTWEEAAAQARLLNAQWMPEFTDADWLRFCRQTCRDDGTGRPVPDMDPRIGDAMRAARVPLPDLWAAFGALAAVPTLLLRGANSDVLAARTVARMRALMPGLHYREIANRGHAPTLDEPDSRAALSEFLATTAGQLRGR